MSNRNQPVLATLVAILCASSLGFASGARAATFVVTSAADTAGATCGATCTLRQAITASNALAGSDTINFAIPTPIKTEILIQPASPLPTITQQLAINGYSATFTSVNTLASGSDAKLRIRVDGTNAGAGTNGFGVCGNGVSIRGLTITGFEGAAIYFGRGTTGTACANAPTGGLAAGNFIGLRSDGTTSDGNGEGIHAFNAVVTVGGATVADRNLVAESDGGGVLLQGLSTSNSNVLNNLIGTDRTGTLDRGNGGAGIIAGDSIGNLVLGITIAPNRIANNGNGIVLNGAAGDGNTWYANGISGNSALGIDLNDDGVTANDFNDADTGPNQRQNFPVITAASRSVDGVAVTGSLDIGGFVTKTYVLAFYASPGCDASGNGEGERFLGAVSKSLLNPGNQSFSIDVKTDDPLPPGTVITATATDPAGSTSEFSACFALDPPPIVVTKTADTNDGACNADCSLREAIVAANAAAAGVSNTIQFAIPGGGPFTISPATNLPTITHADVTIDGYSQPGAAPSTDAEGSNATILVRIDGAADTSAVKLGLAVCADSVEIRGLSITGFAGGGVAYGIKSIGPLCDGAISGGVVAGSYIGLQPDGTTSGGNGRGVTFTRASGIVGGPALADRNVISSNGEFGVFLINPDASESAVLNNLIGTDKTGTQDRGNGSSGVALQNGITEALVGTAAAPNVIAFNGRGIRLSDQAGAASTAVRNTWYANRVFANDGVGIDIGADDATPDDPDDADTGPNNVQNHPVLALAQRTAAGIQVIGSLDVPAGASGVSYRVALYASASCDASGSGEGARFLGSALVSLTDASSEGFSLELATTDPLPDPTQITATATDAQGSTSEFSPCVLATDAASALVVTSTADTDGNACGATCTLRQAINVANLRPGPDPISFNLPGAGPFAITPATPLPTVTETATIDAYTQLGSAQNALDEGDDAVVLVQLDGPTGSGTAAGFSICGDDVVIRGFSITNFPVGVRIGRDAGGALCPSPPIGAALGGNFIGLLPDGTTARGNAGANVLVDTAGALVGGPATKPGARNLIAAAGGAGVLVLGGGVDIDNNYIGTDRNGTADRGNAQDGVQVTGAETRRRIGFNAGNRIAYNRTGVLVASAGTTGVLVENNEFIANDGLAIDLSASAGPDGVTANDVDDPDTGANNRQNFPVLANFAAGDGAFSFDLTLDAPLGTYRVDLYESAACDASGHGEGEILLASTVVKLTGGTETFPAVLELPPPAPGHVLTATATDDEGNTSEFSACLVATVVNALFSDSFEDEAP